MAFDAVNAALILSKGVGCPPNDMQSFNATSQEDGIKVTFTGPKNSYVFGAANNDTLLSTPAGVMIRYSDTDYPADITDGTLLGVYNENYNPVNPTEVTDNLIGLVFEQTYYFSAFPFSVDGIYNKSQAPANRASCQWVGNKGTINVTVATYEGYTGGEIGEYTITLVDQASSGPQNIQRTASGTGLTQIGNLDEGKTYVVTLTDVGGLTCDPSEPITIVAGETYNVTMTYREKYGTISVTVTTANDAFSLGEYKVTLLDQASESPQNIEKQATGKTTTVFENLIAGKQYKVRLGAATNWIAPVDSDTLTVLGGDDVAITMTYSPGLGSVVVNVTTNPTGMPIGSYTITLTPTAGGSSLQQSGNGSQSLTFNSVPIGTYNITGSSINHYTFSGGQVSVTGGQQSSHNAKYTFSATLQDSSWEEIDLIAESGQAKEFFSIGDKKTVRSKKLNGSFDNNGNFTGSESDADIDYVFSHYDGNYMAFTSLSCPVTARSNSGVKRFKGTVYTYFQFSTSGLCQYLSTNYSTLFPENHTYLKNVYITRQYVWVSSIDNRANQSLGGVSIDGAGDGAKYVYVPPAWALGAKNKTSLSSEFSAEPWEYFTTASRRKLGASYCTSSLSCENNVNYGNPTVYASINANGNLLSRSESPSWSFNNSQNFPLCFFV